MVESVHGVEDATHSVILLSDVRWQTLWDVTSGYLGKEVKLFCFLLIHQIGGMFIVYVVTISHFTKRLPTDTQQKKHISG